MSAADQLALAHERMTPEEVREHALALASAVESQDKLIAIMLDTLLKVQKMAATSGKSRVNTQIAVRQCASLFAAGRKREARMMLRELASVEIVRDDLPQIDRSLFLKAEESWPDIFNPRGTAT